MAEGSIKRDKCLERCATEGGNFVGRDPRQMGRAGLEAAGFDRMSPIEVIRAKCIDCCAGSAHEVRLCVTLRCPSWPYRMGRDPFRAPLSEERRDALRDRAVKGLSLPAKACSRQGLGEAPVSGLPDSPPTPHRARTRAGGA
jgi:hypothetical protein